ncbi:MAG: type I methionyl aminopeptidase, partial [bacterium]
MIQLKSPREIEILRRANVIVAEVLDELKGKMAPGVTTLELDALAEELTYKKKARPAFKGYTLAGRVYPNSLCISVNDEIVHGIPSDRALRPGDIVGLDFGVIYDGFYGDSAVTVGVGDVTDTAKRLMQVTEEALCRGIDEMKEGGRIGDLSAAVQKTVEAAGFSVVRDFVGHGIGK